MQASTHERATAKYLRQYAENELDALPAACGPFRRVLVVPAYDEAPPLLDRLDALFNTTSALLIILVINRPSGSTGDTSLSLALQQRYRLDDCSQNLNWYRAAHHGALLVVDRYSEGRGIPAAQGVGLARKIGCDIACQLMHLGQVTSRWIFTSDADVQWPADYFDAGHNAATTCSALSLRFAHQPQPGLSALPTQLYEFSLHYYVLGLAWAGSPYAHHSLGSTLAIDYQHYARVRGFPRRAAGEDFYLLNKLAKSGPIATPRTPHLTLLDRQSTRAPFGTGVARERIDALASPLHDFTLYHPLCFADLRDALHWLDELGNAPSQSQARWQQQRGANAQAQPPWLDALADLGIDKALAHAARHGRDPAGFKRHLHQWFDGFRTLKFIHTLRNQHYASVNLEALLAQAKAQGQLPPLPAQPRNQDAQAQWLQRCNQQLANQLFT